MILLKSAIRWIYQRIRSGKPDCARILITTFFFSALGIASLYAFLTGRHVLGLLMLIGFLQDPVRKLVPGEPVIFIVTIGVLFAFVLLGIWVRRGFLFSLEPFLGWTRNIQMPLILFIAVLLAQLIHSLLRFGNVVVGLIGLVTYIAPFLAVIVGYYTVNSAADVRRFMFAYVLIGIFVAATVLMSFLGYDFVIFSEVGEGLKIYDQGTVLKSYSGIMRTGEIAAWHISTAACLVLTLTVSSTKNRSLLWALVIVALMMVAVALTGRRKMLMMSSLFLLFYFFSYYYYRKTLDARYFLTLFSVMIVAWFAYEAISLDSYSESLSNYIARGSSVFSDASGRFVKLGINPVQWAYNRVGLLGGGLGIASQGSYLFNVSHIAGGSGEGGLGKIMVELGLPGLLSIGWLVLAITRYMNSILKLAAQPFVAPQLLPLMVSLSVMLGVNAVTFSVATQVYGDIFILILMGLFGGFIFALPKLVISAAGERNSATTESFQNTANA